MNYNENTIKESIESINLQTSHYEDTNELGLFWGSLGMLYFRILYCIYHKESLDQISDQYNIIGEKLMTSELSDEYLLFSCSEFGIVNNLLQYFDIIKEDQLIQIPHEVEVLFDKYLERSISVSNYNLFFGAQNFASYFYCGYIATNKQYHKIVLEKFIDLLKQKAISANKEQIYWSSKLSIYINENGANFTYFHGMNSIIAFLNKLYKSDIKRDTCFDLIKKSCNFLLNYKPTFNPGKLNEFPVGVYTNLRAIDGDVPVINLNAGDLMIGYTLLLSGKTLSDEHLQHCGMNVINHADHMIGKDFYFNKKTGVLDGLTGIALIMGKIGDLTGEPYYKRRSLELYFYEAIKLHERSDFNDYSIMTGLSGIGSCFISAISNNPAINLKLLLL